METSLHRHLKQLYAAGAAAGVHPGLSPAAEELADTPAASPQVEVRLGRYRIDAVSHGVLVEIQHGSLAAIRDKVARLLRDHRLLVVKPIVARKLLVKRSRRGGSVVERRKSPKRGRLLDLFDELVYFTRVFPHPNLTLEAVLVDVEEWRFPGRGRRWRRRRGEHQVEDQKLLAIREVRRFQHAADLLSLLPAGLPAPFHTADLAAAMAVSRPTAQRIAYCLRHAGAVQTTGKRGNALLYKLPSPAAARRAG